MPLEGLALHIMKSGFGSPVLFLQNALSPPSNKDLLSTMESLENIGAVTVKKARQATKREQSYAPSSSASSSSSSSSSLSVPMSLAAAAAAPSLKALVFSLTPFGHLLSSLPCDIRIGRMLIYGALMQCLQPMLIIAAAMSCAKSIWSSTGGGGGNSSGDGGMSRNELIGKLKQHLGGSVAYSDHLAIFCAYDRWFKAKYASSHQSQRQGDDGFFSGSSDVRREDRDKGKGKGGKGTRRKEGGALTDDGDVYLRLYTRRNAGGANSSSRSHRSGNHKDASRVARQLGLNEQTCNEVEALTCQLYQLLVDMGFGHGVGLASTLYQESSDAHGEDNGRVNMIKKDDASDGKSSSNNYRAHGGRSSRSDDARSDYEWLNKHSDHPKLIMSALAVGLYPRMVCVQPQQQKDTTNYYQKQKNLQNKSQHRYGKHSSKDDILFKKDGSCIMTESKHHHRVFIHPSSFLHKYRLHSTSAETEYSGGIGHTSTGSTRSSDGSLSISGSVNSGSANGSGSGGDGGQWMVYQEKVRTSQVFIRGASLVPILPVLLFGGHNSFQVDYRQRVVCMDGWVEVNAVGKTAVMIGLARDQIDSLMKHVLAVIMERQKNRGKGGKRGVIQGKGDSPERDREEKAGKERGERRAGNADFGKLLIKLLLNE